MLFVEYISQECYKLLIIMTKLIHANIVLLIRSGLWCYISIALMSIKPELRNLDFVLIAWVFGGGAGILYCAGVLMLSKLGWRSRSSRPVDYSWIKKGISVASVILIGTLAYRSVYFLDKILVKAFANYEVIAVYGLFLSIVSVAQSFLETGIISYYYPRLVAAYNQNARQLFYSEAAKMLQHTFIFTGTLCSEKLLAIKYASIHR